MAYHTIIDDSQALHEITAELRTDESAAFLQEGGGSRGGRRFGSRVCTAENAPKRW